MFYATAVSGERATIGGETAEHMRRVLRVEVGQRFEISDGQRVHLAEVTSFGKGTVEFSLVEPLPDRRPGANITVSAALIKFDRFEWLIEKCSELGVRRIVPVIAARCDTGLDKAAAKRQARWLRIALESGQQCRRAIPIQIYEPVAFQAALGNGANVRLFLDEAGGEPLLPQCGENEGEVALLVGPEGGWTEGERAAALATGWCAATLGDQILRAETAAIAAVSVVQGVWWSKTGR